MKNYIKKYTNVLDKKICNDIIENCLDSEWEKAKIMNKLSKIELRFLSCFNYKLIAKL